MPTLLGLIKQEGPGQDLVCFCVAACLASLVLDEAAMEAVVQRKDSPVMFENALALLEKTIDSLDTNAVEVGWTAALQLGVGWRAPELALQISACRNPLEVGSTAVAMTAKSRLCAFAKVLSPKRGRQIQTKPIFLQAASRVKQHVLQGALSGWCLSVPGSVGHCTESCCLMCLSHVGGGAWWKTQLQMSWLPHIPFLPAP